MQRFEEHKWNLDYNSPQSIVFSASNPRHHVTIRPDVIKQAFIRAFGAGLDVLKEEVTKILGLGRDFAVVLCGGSYCNPGLRKSVTEFMDEIKLRAQERKLNVKYVFLADFDTHWSSAVSAGAAISVLRDLPAPADVLAGSAIAIQKQTYVREAWRGQTSAEVLFAHGEASAVVYRVAKTVKPQRFTLVCDPNPEPDPEDPYMPRQINIGHEDEVLIGPPSTYDLGWEIDAAELPPRKICFSMEGDDLSRLAAASQDGGGGSASQGLEARRPEATIWLSCSQLNWTREKKYHRLNKKWKLTLCTDPYSKYLSVTRSVRLPANCGQCLSEIHHKGMSCQVCPDFGLCWACYEQDDFSHDESHDFTDVALPGGTAAE